MFGTAFPILCVLTFLRVGVFIMSLQTHLAIYMFKLGPRRILWLIILPVAIYILVTALQQS
jgi:hypothetical protein